MKISQTSFAITHVHDAIKCTKSWSCDLCIAICIQIEIVKFVFQGLSSLFVKWST